MRLICPIFLAASVALAPSAFAQPAPFASVPAYADLADLADPAELVIHAQIRKQAMVESERSPNLAAGYARLYIEARTVALLSGSAPIGESLKYLVDVPLDAKGKPPKLKKQEVILFAHSANRPGEIRLVAPDAQLTWSESTAARLRPILAELAVRDAPPKLRGVREALSVPGNLAGESETQVFIDTVNGQPVSLSIIRRPGMKPAWGVSWSEIVDQAARPPQPETLAWYRLACFLPDSLPVGASLSSDPVSRSQASRDYRFVIEQLGPCPRIRRANQG